MAYLSSPPRVPPSLAFNTPEHAPIKLLVYTMKRLFFAFALAFGLLIAPNTATAQQTAETQAALSPEQVLQMLKDGNERFLSGETVDRDHSHFVAKTATGQFPIATVLGCIDSRVPPEIVFDKGVGDIFSGRVAGNFINTDMLGSFEFATAVAGSKVIVVLGHTSCGAVKGACDHVQLGNLTQTLSNIAPAVYATTTDGERSSKNIEFVNDVAHTNVEQTVQNILDRSPVIAGLVEEGKLIVVGAMHDVSTGKVTFMEPVTTMASAN